MLLLTLQFIISAILLVILPIIFFQIIPTKDKLDNKIQESKNKYNFENEEDGFRLFKLLFEEYFFEFFSDDFLKFYSDDIEKFYEYSKEKFLRLSISEKEKCLERKDLVDFNYYINKIQLAAMLFVTSSIVYFMINFFQILQIILFSPYEFLITESIVMWFFPILLFSICLSVPILLKYVGTSSMKAKLSEKYFNKMLKLKANRWVKNKSGNIKLHKKSKIVVIAMGVVFLIFLTFLISHNAIIRDDGIYASSWWSYDHNFCSWNNVTNIYYELGRVKVNSNEMYEHETPHVVIVNNGDVILSFSTNDRFSYLEPYCYQIERHGRTSELINYIKVKTGLEFKEVVFDRNTKQYIEN